MVIFGIHRVTHMYFIWNSPYGSSYLKFLDFLCQLLLWIVMPSSALGEGELCLEHESEFVVS